MTKSITALVFSITATLAACGSAPGATRIDSDALGGSESGAAGEGASTGQSGASNEPSPDEQQAPLHPVDTVLGACGPTNCAIAPSLDLHNSGEYGCYDGICTFTCNGKGNIDATISYCASLGGVCAGFGGEVTCR